MTRSKLCTFGSNRKIDTPIETLPTRDWNSTFLWGTGGAAIAFSGITVLEMTTNGSEMKRQAARRADSEIRK